jgi:hypothetical protein
MHQVVPDVVCSEIRSNTNEGISKPRLYALVHQDGVDLSKTFQVRNRSWLLADRLARIGRVAGVAPSCSGLRAG